jgi:hypothetical protein
VEGEHEGEKEKTRENRANRTGTEAARDEKIKVRT